MTRMTGSDCAVIMCNLVNTHTHTHTHTHILDIKFVGRTSRGHTGGRSHTGFFIHLPSAVRALIFLARIRIQPFLSLVDREVDFFVLTI